MGCEFEVKSGFLRLGRTFEKYGDKYDFVCHVYIVDHVGYIEGGESMTDEKLAAIAAERDNIRRELSPFNVNRVEYWRLKDGKLIKRGFDL